jgi:hypothetical protein
MFRVHALRSVVQPGNVSDVRLCCDANHFVLFNAEPSLCVFDESENGIRTLCRGMSGRVDLHRIRFLLMDTLKLKSRQPDAAIAACLLAFLKNRQWASDFDEIGPPLFECLTTGLEPGVLLKYMVDDQWKLA